MNIALECGAVKAPLPPIQWTLRDQQAALDLHCLAKFYCHKLKRREEAFEDLRQMFERGAIGAASWRGSSYKLTPSDAHALFHLVVDGMGGWN